MLSWGKNFEIVGRKYTFFPALLIASERKHIHHAKKLSMWKLEQKSTGTLIPEELLLIGTSCPPPPLSSRNLLHQLQNWDSKNIDTSLSQQHPDPPLAWYSVVMSRCRATNQNQNKNETLKIKHRMNWVVSGNIYITWLARLDDNGLLSRHKQVENTVTVEIGLVKVIFGLELREWNLLQVILDWALSPYYKINKKHPAKHVKSQASKKT